MKLNLINFRAGLLDGLDQTVEIEKFNGQGVLFTCKALAFQTVYLDTIDNFILLVTT